MSKSGKEAFGTGKNGEEYPLEAWHLHLFGILPQFQGKGYGKKLVQFAEAEVRVTWLSFLILVAAD
jgi:GNAT superfamily N-acetyltransferase